jgi:hypothetical protein
MEATKFKTELKKIKENLKGITLSVQSKYSTLAFYKLNDFGQEILQQEAYGKSFSIQRIWTKNDGIMFAKNFTELKRIFKKYEVTGIRFSAYRDEVYDECSFIRSFGRLD